MPWSCPWPSWGIDRSNLVGTLSDSASASRQFGPTGLGWPQARYTCTVKSRMVQPVLPRCCEQSRDHRPAYSSAARSTPGTSTPVATPSRSKVAHSTSAARSRPRRRARRAHRRSAALRSAGPTPSSPRRARGSGARGTPPEPRRRSHRPVPRCGPAHHLAPGHRRSPRHRRIGRRVDRDPRLPGQVHRIRPMGQHQEPDGLEAEFPRAAKCWTETSAFGAVCRDPGHHRPPSRAPCAGPLRCRHPAAAAPRSGLARPLRRRRRSVRAGRPGSAG